MLSMSDSSLAERALEVRRLGTVRYAEAATLQEELVNRRRTGEIPDQLLLLEHPHVITLGTGSRSAHVLAPPSTLKRLGVEVHPTRRGGDVTYHGPGQLVGYPILDLNPDRKDLHRYLRDLEQVLILVLGHFGIESWRSEGWTGVWTAEGKIAAIGVRVASGWITSHGFALNVSTDLTYFETIVPCGIEDRPVTTMASLLNCTPSIAEVATACENAFSEVFERRPVRVDQPSFRSERGPANS